LLWAYDKFIRIPSIRDDIKKGIKAELSEYLPQLYMTAFLVFQKYALLRKDNMQTIYNGLIGYEKDPYEPEFKRQCDYIKEKLDMKDDDLQTTLDNDAQIIQQTGADMSTTFKKIELPFTRMNISKIDTFSTDIQRRLFYILNRNNVINQEIDNVLNYLSLTFTVPYKTQQLHRDNLDALYTNINNLEKAIGRYMYELGDKIVSFLDDL